MPKPIKEAGGEEAAPRSAGAIPGDFNLLAERDMTAAIRDHLKQDGQIDTEELHVVCRRGVVYLTGKIPSEFERQILLHTLTDVLGFREIVDRLDVAELLWQTERRTRDPGLDAIQRWEELPGSEDIVEAQDEGREFVAPAKPVPDGE